MSKARGPYRVDPLGYKKANEALDKKAENARELGLDYEPAQQEPVAWRELCRRLYVELFHCDQQMMATRDEEGDPMWQQGATVRDVLADAKAALETSPQPAQRKPLTDEARENLMKKAWAEWLTMKDDDHSFAWHFLFARHFSFEVEAAHGIKENT